VQLEENRIAGKSVEDETALLEAASETDAAVFTETIAAVCKHFNMYI